MSILSADALLKRLPRLLCAATALFLLAGCGATEATTSPTSTPTAADREYATRDL